MQPTKLLQNLGVVWVLVKDSMVRCFCIVEIFLLLVHVANLEPYVLLGERRGRRVDNVLKALQTRRLDTRVFRGRPEMATYLKRLPVFLLLLVDYAQPEIYLVGLVKIWRHAHYLRKGFLCMLQRSISVVQNTNPVPESRFLGVWKVD